MKEKISLYIPIPCNENWNEMTTAEQGRFCKACNKQVIDFSLMTDQQVLNYFSKATGRVCGRLTEDQLQRPLQPAVITKRRNLWLAILMPLSLLFERAVAQKKTVRTVKKSTLSDNVWVFTKCTPKKNSKEMFLPVTALIIKGRVTDENRQPVPWAIVKSAPSGKFVTTDTEGNFSINIDAWSSNIELEVSGLGYQTTMLAVGETNSTAIIILKKDETMSIRSSSLSDQTLYAFAGGISVGQKITKKEKRDTLLRKITGTTAFKTYPNPVLRGTELKIEIKKAGNYFIQLISNNGVPVATKETTTVSDATLATLTIPSSVTQGVYYLRVMDEKNRKQYTDKIILQ